MAPPNWNTADQIRTHQLATSIINGHGTENDVFDDHMLGLLQEFCLDPTVANRDRMVAEHEWRDAPGEKAGEKAAREGHLVGVLVSRHGTGEAAFDERDLEMLKGWFERGMPGGQRVVR